MSDTLGGRVLLARRDLNINQDELARRTGVSRPFISDIERGKTTNVGMETVFALAEALGVRAEHLFGFSDVIVDEGILEEGWVAYEVDDPEEHRLIQEIIRLFQGLKSEDQRFALSFMRRMAADGPRVIGDE